MDIDKSRQFMGGRTPEELKELMLMRFSAMTPEQYSDHLHNEHLRSFNLGKEKEQEEIVCRLLASGMDVEEIAVILGTRRQLIQLIQDNNAAIKIPEYEKKLRTRRRRK